MRSALFVEREDALIAGDWRTPADVRLLPGVAAEAKRLALAGVALVVVCDRWLRADRDAHAFAASQRALEAALAAQGAALAGAWHAPSADHAWVKPRPGMLLAAAKALSLDLARSWLVGVEPRDARAAAQAGCAGAVLIGDGDVADDLGIVVARAGSLADAPRVMVPRGGGCWHER